MLLRWTYYLKYYLAVRDMVYAYHQYPLSTKVLELRRGNTDIRLQQLICRWVRCIKSVVFNTLFLITQPFLQTSSHEPLQKEYFGPHRYKPINTLSQWLLLFSGAQTETSRQTPP